MQWATFAVVKIKIGAKLGVKIIKKNKHFSCSLPNLPSERIWAYIPFKLETGKGFKSHTIFFFEMGQFLE